MICKSRLDKRTTGVIMSERRGGSCPAIDGVLLEKLGVVEVYDGK